MNYIDVENIHLTCIDFTNKVIFGQQWRRSRTPDTLRECNAVPKKHIEHPIPGGTQTIPGMTMVS